MAQFPESEFGTVLVTSGNGLVGSHMVDAFVADRIFEHVIGSQHRQRQYQNPKATYRFCNIVDPAQITAVVDEIRPQVIVHTVSPGAFAPPRLQRQVNYSATKQLLEKARRSRWVQAFVYTSTIEAVVLKAGLKSKQETEEEAVLNDLKSKNSPYAKTKGAADALVLSFNTGRTQTNIGNSDGHFQNILLTTSLRLGALYGERDETTIRELLKLVNTCGARVQAHVLASKALPNGSRYAREPRVDGEAFYITDGAPMLFWKFSRTILIGAGDRKLNGQMPVRIVQIPVGVVLLFATMGELTYKVFTFGHKVPKIVRHHFDFMRKGCWFSIEKARERLGYEPIFDTDEGIRRSVKWFREDQEGSRGSNSARYEKPLEEVH